MKFIDPGAARWSSRRLLAFAATAAVLAGMGCAAKGSGGGSSVLPTDAHPICVTPTTSAQDVALPVTGGVSATLSFGPFPADATGCDGVRIATGDSIQTQLTRKNGLSSLSSGSSKPLLQISVGDAFDGNSAFGETSIVTGMQLKADAVVFPDGDYYMSITKGTGSGTRVQVIKLTASNGVLTVAPLHTDVVFGTEGSNSQLPQLVLANTTAILTLYPKGVMPPDPGEDETNTPQKVDVSDAGLPPLPTDPPETLPTSPGAHGLPPPVPGTLIGYAHAVWTPGCSNNPGCDLVHPIESNGGSTTPIDGPAGMSGTVRFDMNIGYMQILAIDIDCPSDWDVDVGFNGSGVITIPASHPLSGATCVITYSTVRADGGSGYEFTAGLRGLDIGAH